MLAFTVAKLKWKNAWKFQRMFSVVEKFYNWPWYDGLRQMLVPVPSSAFLKCWNVKTCIVEQVVFAAVVLLLSFATDFFH